jgi:hypothetical protein
MTNYLKLYDSNGERYLLEEVGPHFRTTGIIKPVDFFMIFIWKAERAKTYERERLKAIAGSFTNAVAEIANSLYSTEDQKERLQILMNHWKMYLPMASAVLTILYPDEFTVYDRRVCEQLKIKYRSQARFSEHLWNDYRQLKEAVIKNTPSGLSLREKDRYLWAKSRWDAATRECQE